eukprot:9342290-Ditylum_brightwellii.AAC.1
MTWEAQLNNMENELATEARNSINPTMLKQVDLFPASKVSLIINRKVILCQYHQAIQNAITPQDLQKGMEDRFKWSTTIGEKIDWATHGRLLTGLHFYRHKFILKLIHERSPVRGMSYNPSPSE